MGLWPNDDQSANPSLVLLANVATFFLQDPPPIVRFVDRQKRSFADGGIRGGSNSHSVFGFPLHCLLKLYMRRSQGPCDGCVVKLAGAPLAPSRAQLNIRPMT